MLNINLWMDDGYIQDYICNNINVRNICGSNCR